MRGTVCHYDQKSKFGFINVPGQKQTVFFHNAQQRHFFCDLDAEIYDSDEWIEEPKVGDEVIIITVETMPKGPKATAWAKSETLRRSVELQNMMYVYRLRLRDGYEHCSDPKPKYTTVWEGRNLLDLKHKTYAIKVEGAGQYSYFFEYFNGEDWEHCGDPRP